MTTLLVAIAARLATVFGVAVLPWSAKSQQASEDAWRELVLATMSWVGGQVTVPVGLPVEAGVAPPDPPPVWAPPADRRLRRAC